MTITQPLSVAQRRFFREAVRQLRVKETARDRSPEDVLP